jgi:hypothetical protein
MFFGSNKRQRPDAAERVAARGEEPSRKLEQRHAQRRYNQTIRLSKGKHSSPEEGACAMELASMLAGESFTDEPASVCPVIASFLRAYNDSVDDERRRDLLAYAAKVVGSRACAEVQSAREERLAAWRFEILRGW